MKPAISTRSLTSKPEDSLQSATFFPVQYGSRNELASLKNTASLSAEGLKNNYIIADTEPLFSPLRARLIALKLNFAERSPGWIGLYPLRRDRWLDEGESKRNYDEAEHRLNKIVGNRHFRKLQNFADQIRGELEANFEGTLDRFSLNLRTCRFIKTKLLETGQVTGCHRHSYPPIVSIPADFIEITILKNELGPGPVIIAPDGAVIRPYNGHTTFFTDVLHGSPPDEEKGTRLLIVIDARFSSEKYRSYYESNSR